MTSIQFRPKYEIEQYVITFQFPEGSTGDVKLAVEVEIGESGLALGPVFRFQYTVSVGIAGGAPGSVYRILCSFGDVEFVGRVAVKESAAIVPEGASVAPFTRVVTTPPYPMLAESSVGLGVSYGEHEWRVIRKDTGASIDLTALGARMGAAELRQPLFDLELPPDELVLGAIIGTGGVRRLRHDVEASMSEVALGARIGTGYKQWVRFDAAALTNNIGIGARIGTGAKT